MNTQKLNQAELDKIFPASKTDEFFEAIYGGAEEGAYDIVLTAHEIGPDQADMAFELRRREGQCLKCNLTYGLPEVFKRHPVLNLDGIAKDLSQILGWETKPSWEVHPVQEIDDNLHIIPFTVRRN